MHVYHSSKIHYLKSIEPRVSTHGESWVYAIKKREHSLMFLGNNNDFVNEIGFHDGEFYIAERFKESLEYAYQGKVGSIYTLAGADFKEGMTGFVEEMVCDHACEVLSEEKIADALWEIFELEKKGMVKIYRFGNEPDWVQKDKKDLIEKAVEWAKHDKVAVLNSVEVFHPEIYEEVRVRVG